MLGRMGWFRMGWFMGTNLSTQGRHAYAMVAGSAHAIAPASARRPSAAQVGVQATVFGIDQRIAS